MYRPVGPLAIALAAAIAASLVLARIAGESGAALAGWALAGSLGMALAFVALAARNLKFLGDPEAHRGPWLSVLWLVMPLLNLAMCHQVLAGLWRDSQSESRRPVSADSDWSVMPVNVWWGLVLGFVGVRLFGGRFGVAPWVGQALYSGAGLAFIVVVLGIAVRQREQWLDLERRRALELPTVATLR